MTAAPVAVLQQLGAVPGVVGSMVFEPSGQVLARAFPAVFDGAGLQQLAAQLSGDAYFQEWMAGDAATLDLRFADGQVLLRTLGGSWLLVLATMEANPQLLAMSLTQALRRLRPPAGAAAEAAPPSRLEQLRAIAIRELGDHADQALEILAAAGTTPKDLQRATADIEKLTRLFISKSKAQELGQQLRAVLDG
jgi:predicted regulator of Ras-like GTPase activity (Roadblock/LC7/MglB family)